VHKYRAKLHTQLQAHNVYKKLDSLQAKAAERTWTDNDTTTYQNLDTIITEAMLHAERTAGRTYTTTYEWSPTLKAAVQARRYWALRLRHIHRPSTATHSLQQYKKEGGITNDPYATEAQIRLQLAKATATLKEHQKNHQTL
jgi:hypothetical protein